MTDKEAILCSCFGVTPPRPRMMVPRGSNRFDPFERLPDEVMEQIFCLASSEGISASNDSTSSLGLKADEEIFHEVKARQRALGPLRLVSRRFLQLSAPLFFRQLLISHSRGQKDEGDDIIAAVTELLSTTTGPQEAAKTNGQHVRKLILMNRDDPPSFVPRLLQTIHRLIPNLAELSAIDLSYLEALLTPSISFPYLEALTDIEVGLQRGDWNLYDHSTALPSTTLFSHEIFFGILNHHPCIKRLTCRGVCLDYTNSSRMISLLLSSQLAAALLPNFCRPAHFAGLTEIHFGHFSVVDLHFLQALPTFAPQLQGLHIDVGCHLEDRSSVNNEEWTLLHLLRSLTKLTHFTFISQRALPLRNRSTRWAFLDQILKVSPQLQSLNVRSDLLQEWTFFELLGKTALRCCSIYYIPILTPETVDKWSIISFDSVQTFENLSRMVHAFNRGGLSWPGSEDSKRDIWLKLKCLSQLGSSEEE